jgi:ubiquinone/menaquinone biosynthesis C-methylase UbiE
MNIIVEHYNKLANSYDEKSLNRLNYLNSVDTLVKNNLPINSNLLDVGCGTGNRIRKLTTGLNLTINGCDISPKMIDIAKTNIDNVTLQDMCNLNYRDKEFDVVTCLFNAFGHLDSKDKRIKTLKQFNRVLKDDGVLFIDVLNFYLLTPPFKSNGDKFFKLDVDGEVVDGYVHGFTHREMLELLQETDFIIDSTSEIDYETGEVESSTGQLFYMCRKQ